MNDEQAANQAFILEHSGQPKRATQCGAHSSLAVMTYAETRRAMTAHGLTPISRWWLFQVCEELGVKRRGRSGPKPAGADAILSRQERDRRYYERVSADPERREARLKRMREQYHRRKSKGRKRAKGT